MRDILEDLETGKHLSDRDPVRRAQNQMRTQLPNRFYKTVTTAETPVGHVIHLDGKPVKTPARAVMALPTAAGAQLVADEFEAQGEKIDPVTMPVMRLVNTAIDGVASDTQAVLDDILRFASSDLVCYRAGAPEGLIERQNEAWNPVIDWARQRLGARLFLTEGVIHVEQPREAIDAIGIHLKMRDEPLRLAAIHVMTSLTGSALLALAVDTGEMEADSAWAAAHVDEDWNISQWGEDAEAAARRAFRKRDMLAAAGLLKALG